jgi:hypothetical protein
MQSSVIDIQAWACALQARAPKVMDPGFTRSQQQAMDMERI